MGEAFIIAGGVYTLALIIFHVFFWRIFKWPAALAPLGPVNAATMQVLNICLTFTFFIFAGISFVHTDEMLGTRLGQAMLVSLSALWLMRAVLQPVFYGWRHRASVGLTVYFLLGAFLYGAPALM